MVNDKAAETIPETCTIAQMARVLGYSERYTASLKAAGRIPTFPDGRIDLRTLTKIGYRELIRRGRDEQAGVLPGMSEEDRAEALMRYAVDVAVHLVMTAMTEPGAESGKAAARALRLAYEALDLPAGEEPLPDELEVVG